MIVSDSELDLTPALDDLVLLHPGVLSADPGITYRIEDGPFGDHWFVLFADPSDPRGQDWAGTIHTNDVRRVTRLIDTGVMQWDQESIPDEDPSES